MSDSWETLGDITRRIMSKNAPVTYEVPLARELALSLSKYAMDAGKKPETIIAEATRAYLGDAA